MRPRDRLKTRWAETRALGRMFRHLPKLRPSAAWNAARLLELQVARRPERVAVAWRDRRITWRELDAAVNRSARALREIGVGPGDVVALLMDNRPEYLVVATALSRLRAIGALINNQITGSALAHAIRIAGSRRVVVGSEHAAKIDEVLAELGPLGRGDVWVQRDEDAPAATGFGCFDSLVAAQSDAPPEDTGRPRADECMCYIYTSGTTGLPKAAIVSNARFLLAGVGFGRVLMALRPEDVSYLTTPLYHSVGMFVGWASTLVSGSCMALRRKFSASRFWDDVRDYDATVFVYIGELCRYLLNQPAHPDERRHRLRLASGNGLRPDIWQAFQERFAIPLIREYYGATEGNAPLLNLTGRPGMVGRMLPMNALVRCDLETGEPWRGPDGRCERVGVGETGLFLGRIGRFSSFDGYVDAAATQKKIVCDVFEPGDRYFDSGDLLTLHEHGWLGFADRVGDTFRWKGENVSTNEVAEILNGAPGVLESNVYGVRVPGADGRAGMASVNCGDGFSISAFAGYVIEHLSVHQRPYFVRLQKEMRITGTFKHQKVDYRNEGYDPRRVPDPVYLLQGDAYVPLDAATFEALESGRLALR